MSNGMKYIVAGLLLVLSRYAMAGVETDTLRGRITDQDGMAMAAVIIEVERTDIYTLSDVNGRFELVLPKRELPAVVSFKFVDYFTRRIDVTEKMMADSLMVTLLPGDDEKAKELSAKRRHRQNGFGIFPSYSYFKSYFNSFTELSPAQILKLNNNSHYIGFGLEGYYSNAYVQLNFGFTPLQRSFTEKYRHLTESLAVSFNVGYAFSPVRNQWLLITPFVGVNHISYNEYVAPRNTHIDLEDFLSMGYMDYSSLQYTGSIGLKLSVKVASFGRHKRQGIYLSAGAAYNFRINRHPYIFSRATHIHTCSSIEVSPVSAQASIVYMIGQKAMKWK